LDNTGCSWMLQYDIKLTIDYELHKVLYCMNHPLCSITTPKSNLRKCSLICNDHLLVIIFVELFCISRLTGWFVGFSWWTLSASPELCSHDWRKCRHIFCHEKDTRARRHPGQVRVHNFVLSLRTLQGVFTVH